MSNVTIWNIAVSDGASDDLGRQAKGQ